MSLNPNSYSIGVKYPIDECLSATIIIGFDPGKGRRFQLIDVRPRTGVDELFLVGREE